MTDHDTDLFADATVLITGASSGIGRAFAERAARHGARLILVARRAGKLEELAGELRTSTGAEVYVIASDLSVPGAGARLHADVTAAGLEVNVLINNAGVGSHGDLVNADPAAIVAQVQLNVVALTELTTLFLPAMVAARRGAIINIASTAAFQPIPHMAVYGATKAYVLSFTRAMWAETRATGVRVIAVCPGATDTEFFEIAGEAASVGARRTPENVVDTAIRAIGRHRPSVVDGFSNAIVAAFAPRAPERLSIALAERSVRPSDDAPQAALR